MTLLRRTLKVQAALWLLWSLALGLAPRLVLKALFSQPILAEYAWVRASAVMGAVEFNQRPLAFLRRHAGAPVA